MSDVFHESLTNEQIVAVFGVMAACPQHTFQVLTKRAKRMREWFEWLRNQSDPFPAGALEFLDDTATDAIAGHFDCCHLNLIASCRWPLSNVWIGVSVENQAAADGRIPDLIATPAAVRFLSCEPLLDKIDLDHGHWLNSDGGVDWVIAGCESGPGARPCDVDWLRSLRDQCAESGVPFFLKQAREFDQQVLADGSCVSTQLLAIENGPGSKRKRGSVIELPYLDGVQHKAFPKRTLCEDRS